MPCLELHLRTAFGGSQIWGEHDPISRIPRHWTWHVSAPTSLRGDHCWPQRPGGQASPAAHLGQTAGSGCRDSDEDAIGAGGWPGRARTSGLFQGRTFYKVTHLYCPKTSGSLKDKIRLRTQSRFKADTRLQPSRAPPCHCQVLRGQRMCPGGMREYRAKCWHPGPSPRTKALS